MSIYTIRKSTAWIAVHCAATPPTFNGGAKEIRQWHREKGWIDIGYHFVIKRDGTVEAGRPIDTVGAHVEGYNATSVGICLVGGVNSKGQPEDNFTLAQYAALALKLRELKKKYPNATIQGHRDFPKVAKACPSFDVRKWIKETGVFAENHVVVVDATTYVVKACDTLWSISRATGVSVDNLLKANPGTVATNLRIGAELTIPV